ncbi:sulfurtransferase TusA family protein [Maritalea sp.]|uniref:sulfurtransferase TusA family protein n=1 Tax=Maritalea sp. TaxID=2003361 RepID=UPI003EF0E68E
MQTKMEIDTIGLNCPLPVIKAEKALASLKSGERLAVLASDPLAAIDIPNMCNQNGHRLINSTKVDNHLRFEIQKA